MMQQPLSRAINETPVKPTDRPYSRHSREAMKLLGQLIRLARIERRLTAQELATRAGISRALLGRIERGDRAAASGRSSSGDGGGRAPLRRRRERRERARDRRGAAAGAAPEGRATPADGER